MMVSISSLVIHGRSLPQVFSICWRIVPVNFLAARTVAGRCSSSSTRRRIRFITVSMANRRDLISETSAFSPSSSSQSSSASRSSKSFSLSSSLRTLSTSSSLERILSRELKMNDSNSFLVASWLLCSSSRLSYDARSSFALSIVARCSAFSEMSLSERTTVRENLCVFFLGPLGFLVLVDLDSVFSASAFSESASSVFLSSSVAPLASAASFDAASFASASVSALVSALSLAVVSAVAAAAASCSSSNPGSAGISSTKMASAFTRPTVSLWVSLNDKLIFGLPY
mmetsp:Transcript_13739/g.25463  ORF Transcript_13739/g.25463 Transcript_13739/m.25463 type:complete len:285 (-) Transcript_13739:904-1758(-)